LPGYGFRRCFYADVSLIFTFFAISLTLSLPFAADYLLFAYYAFSFTLFFDYADASCYFASFRRPLPIFACAMSPSKRAAQRMIYIERGADYAVAFFDAMMPLVDIAAAAVFAGFSLFSFRHFHHFRAFEQDADAGCRHAIFTCWRAAAPPPRQYCHAIDAILFRRYCRSARADVRKTARRATRYY
jgi:hypothetical protein